MIKYLLPIIPAIFLFVAVNFAQQTPQQDDDVVKVSTSLVQLDAVVTDKKGNPVTNLTADDFEILQDGKRQKITNLLYVNRNINKTVSEQTVSASTKEKTPTPSVAFRPKEVGRVITFVVDDGNCAATISGVVKMKAGLEKFVNEQMLSNDLVAIYRTRAGNSLLQQYTNNKTQLLEIIRKIRWYPPQGICTSITGEEYEPIRDKGTAKPNGRDFETEKDKEFKEKVENFSKDRQATGVIGVLRYAIKGLYPVGGRKILFFMSDSLPMIIGKPENQKLSELADQVKELTVLANRSSVVINSIDVRGLGVSMISSQDDVVGIKKVNPLATEGYLAERAVSDHSRQSGLSFIANETGGKFYRNANNLDGPIERTLDSEKGYYLIAYEPDDETFKGKDFHTIKLNLKREDLLVSSRSGFYGITDEKMRPKPRTADSELYDVLTSPLPNADLNFRLSAYFDNSATKGNFIHAVLFIDGKDITFIDEPGGTKKVVFDIVAVTLNEKNDIIDDTNRTATVHIPADRVEQIRNNGLIYSIDVPVKKEGVYTFRTALRDTTTKRLGASNQSIEVPDLKKGQKLIISGLKISGVDANGKMLPAEAGENIFSPVTSMAISAIRKLRRNSIVAYSCTIYNPQTDTQPKLTVQTNLYYDGKILSEGQPQEIEAGKQSDLSRINDFGYIKLSAGVPIGDYILQVIVKDLKTNKTTSQWIDFEVVE